MSPPSQAPPAAPTYDGKRLIWPWGEETAALDQAVAEADWLQDFILKRTGIDTPVKPIVALPGWWVEMTARGPVVVVNAKAVGKAIVGRNEELLQTSEIDLISRQLDERCRDVED